MTSKLSVLFVYTLFVVSLPTIASNNKLNVCKALVDHGIHDSYDTFSSERRWSQIKKLLSSKEYANWDNAKSAGLDLGINIIEVIDISLGGSTNSSNYGDRRKELLSKSYFELSTRSDFVSQIKTASRSISNSFVQCVDLITSRGGFVGWITPLSAKNVFVINMKNRVSSGGDNFEIENITIRPSKGVDCDLKTFPKTVDGDISISCEKPEAETVMVTVNTSAGDISGIEVAGGKSILYELQARLNRLENSGSLVPTNTVAFFAQNRCPSGWDEFIEMRGRYIVGLTFGGQLKGTTGTPLTNLENRSVGSHSHGYTSTFFAHSNGWRGVTPGPDGEGLGVEWRSNGPAKRGNQSRTTSATGKEYTNAPYIQLLACKKN